MEERASMEESCSGEERGPEVSTTSSRLFLEFHAKNNLWFYQNYDYTGSRTTGREMR